MILRAIVPVSKFDEVLKDLQHNELDRVTRFKLCNEDDGVINVVASGTLDRMLEIAQRVSATIEPGFTGEMQAPDHLVIENHTHMGEYLSETFNGQVSFWSNDFGENL